MTAVAVSGVLLKVVLLPGGGAISERNFLFIMKSLVFSFRFLFVETLNSTLSGFRSSLSEDYLSSLSSLLPSKTRVVFASIFQRMVACLLLAHARRTQLCCQEEVLVV